MLAYLEATVRPKWIARWLQKNPSSPKNTSLAKLMGGGMFHTLAINTPFSSNQGGWASENTKDPENCVHDHCYVFFKILKKVAFVCQKRFGK